MTISLRSKVTIKILNYFFLNPDAERYVNDLADSLESDPKNVHRKLSELEQEGLLKSEFRGKERYFSINNNYPLLEPYRQIFLKTSGIEQRLKQILAKIMGIKAAYLFGSYAQNRMDASSDIDILIVGTHSPLEVQKRLTPLQTEIGREINVVNMDPKEFGQKKRENFLRNIFDNEPIQLL